jgi:hypothetical protein
VTPGSTPPAGYAGRDGVALEAQAGVDPPIEGASAQSSVAPLRSADPAHGGVATPGIPSQVGSDPASQSTPSEADWLDRICPYLLSEDGTYRSTEPDADHRCMAQDPPGTLPTAFQERYCLTERHVRCEMYKFAHSARETALGQEGIPAAQVKSARFRPSVRSVPLALGPSRGTATAARRNRPSTMVVVAAVGAAALVILVILGLTLGGSGGQWLAGSHGPRGPDPTSDASSDPCRFRAARRQRHPVGLGIG